MAPADPRRWPWEPLRDACVCIWGPYNPAAPGNGFTYEKLAARAGIHRDTVGQMHARGIPDDLADRCACAIGLHPCLIWPDWFDRAFDVEPALDPAAADAFDLLRMHAAAVA